MKIYLAKDQEIFSWDPENMDKYWQQCQLFDAYPLGHFIDCTIDEQRSRQAFDQFVAPKGINNESF